MKVLLQAVRDKHDAIQLYDIWIDGAWHGSRRTERQCRAYIAHMAKACPHAGARGEDKASCVHIAVKLR